MVLHRANAVLAANRPTQRKRKLRDVVNHSFGQTILFGSVARLDSGVQVSITRVRDDRDSPPVASRDLINTSKDRRKFTHGHSNVTGDTQPLCGQGRVRKSTCFQQLITGRAAHLDSAVRHTQCGDLCGLLNRVEPHRLPNQHSCPGGWQPRRLKRLNDCHTLRVEHLEHFWLNLARHNCRDRVTRVFDAVEARAKRVRLTWRNLLESHRCSGDHSERALRPHKETGQIKPHNILSGSCPGTNDPSVGKHHLKGRNSVTGDSVRDAPQSTSICRDVSADSRDANTRRVRRKE